MGTDTPTLTHVTPEGGARMVDISEKKSSTRTAVARGRVLLGADAFRLVKKNKVAKGDVLTTAQIAGIMGAKQTSKLIPLCHDVSVHGVEIEFHLNDEQHAVDIRAYTRTVGATGVEMEALTAVSMAGLTIYDMCKSITKDITITDIHLRAKTGGQSGDYRRSDPPSAN